MITFKPNCTTGERYNPTADITSVEDASAYLKALVDWQVTHHGRTAEEAEKIERANIGYYSGYFADEVGARVRKLFASPHPVFEGTGR